MNTKYLFIAMISGSVTGLLILFIKKTLASKRNKVIKESDATLKRLSESHSNIIED